MTSEVNHGERAHAILPPSGKYWHHCPGSIALSANVPPEEPSEYALEGTRAHEAIEKATRLNYSYNDDYPDACETFVESLDDELKECVRGYLNFISTMSIHFHRIRKPVRRLIEERVKLTDYNWGTLDYGLVGENQDGTFDICVVDYKHGVGVEVDATENTQLINYALALAEEYNGNIGTAYLFVYQPRVNPENPYTKWSVSGEALTEYRRIFLERGERAIAIYKGTVVFDPAEHLKAGDHCRWCPARRVCPELLRASNTECLDLLETPLPPAIPTLTISQMVEVLKRKKMIEGFIEGIEEHLAGRLKQGLPVPGFKLVKGQQKRQWKKDKEYVAGQLMSMGIDEPYKTSLVNIGDVEKKIGKGKIGDLTTLTKASLNVVPVEDEREAVDVVNALDGLSEIEG